MLALNLFQRQNPDEMIAHRCIQVPICFSIQYPGLIQIHDFEVLMVNDDPSPGDRLPPETLTTADQYPPGLAILDPGCTRTMYGTERADSFEAELGQPVRGVGDQIAIDTFKIFPIQPGQW